MEYNLLISRTQLRRCVVSRLSEILIMLCIALLLAIDIITDFEIEELKTQIEVYHEME